MKTSIKTGFAFIAMLLLSQPVVTAQNSILGAKGKQLDLMPAPKKNGMIYAGLGTGYNFNSQLETTLCFNYVHKIGKNFDLKEGIKNVLNNEKPKVKPFSRFFFEVGPIVSYNYENEFAAGANFKMVFIKNFMGTLRGHIDYLNAFGPKVQYLRYGIEYQIPRGINLKKRRTNYTLNYFRNSVLSGTDNLNSGGFLGAGVRLYLRDPKKYNR